MKRKNQILRNSDLLLLFFPAMLFYLVFHYAPMYGIIISFKEFNPFLGIRESPWVGLSQFDELFSTPSFLEVLRNTVSISLLRLIFGFPAPILFAILLNEIGSGKYKKTVQTVSYLPHFLSWVVLAGIFIPFLSPSQGPINAVIKLLGGKPIFFLGDPGWFVFTLIITGIWQSIGWGSIVYLAAISGIDTQLYDAASIDGTNRFQNIIYITLPSIMPTIAVLFILNTGHILSAGFDQVFNLYNPAVYGVADIIDTYVYRRGLEGFQYSFATAVGLFKNIIGFLLVLTTNLIARRMGENSIW